jgi:hypothetical protein
MNESREQQNAIHSSKPLNPIPTPHPLLPHPRIPRLNIRQPRMRSIRIPLPLWPGRLKPRLRPALRNQLAHRASPVVANMVSALRLLSSITIHQFAIASVPFGPALPAHFCSERCGCGLIDAEVRGDDDAVVALSAFERDEAPVDFFCDDVRGPCERVAEAAAAPGDPFEDVAFNHVSVCR